MSKKKFKDIELDEQEKIRKVVTKELTDAIALIDAKTGYYGEISFILLADSLRKTQEISIDIALLEKPHHQNKIKVEHYLKVNPDNVLDIPITAYEYGSWYKIYNGVHRVMANKALNKKSIKASLVVPSKEDREDLEKN